MEEADTHGIKAGDNSLEDSLKTPPARAILKKIRLAPDSWYVDTKGLLA